MSELYNKSILRWAAHIPRTERLDNPDATISRTSRICGSKLTADFVFDGDRIADYGQEVKACALGQATSAIVASKVIGLTEAEFAPVAQQFAAMIKDGGPPPDGEWSELAILEPVREHKSRHGSVMLPFEVIMEAFRANRKRQAS